MFFVGIGRISEHCIFVLSVRVLFAMCVRYPVVFKLIILLKIQSLSSSSTKNHEKSIMEVSSFHTAFSGEELVVWCNDEICENRMFK